MQNRLKPMTAKDIIDVTFSIARERFWTLQGVIFLSFLPAAIILLIGLIYFGTVVYFHFSNLLVSPDAWPEIFQGFGFLHILVLVGLFILMVITAMVGTMFNTYGNIRVFKYALHQEKCTVKESFRGMKNKWLWYFLSALLIGVGLSVVVIPLSIVTGIVSVTGSVVLQFIFQIIATLIQLAAQFLICLTPVVIALEDTDAVKAIGRAFTLLSGHRWRVFVVFILTYLLMYVLFGGIIGTLMILIGMAIASKQLVFIVLAVICGLGALMMLNIIILLFYGPLTAIYYDLIIRKEGYDLQLQLKDEDTEVTLDTMTTTNQRGLKA